MVCYIDSIARHLVFLQWSLLNSHSKCTEKSCELSKHVNCLSLFYITFLSTVKSCVQDNHANYPGGAN